MPAPQARVSSRTPQSREATIYRTVVGAMAVALIGFGLLQLMGVIRV